MKNQTHARDEFQNRSSLEKIQQAVKTNCNTNENKTITVEPLANRAATKRKQKSPARNNFPPSIPAPR